MKQVYGDDCLSRNRVHEWFKRFQEGRDNIIDDPNVGQREFIAFRPKIWTIGRSYADVEAIQKASTDILRAILASELNNLFHMLLNRANCCMEANGDRFE